MASRAVDSQHVLVAVPVSLIVTTSVLYEFIEWFFALTIGGAAGTLVLGTQGRGYANFLHILDEGRIAISALSVGVAQGCVDESVKYAKEREAFGKPIGKFQHNRFLIAEMATEAHIARVFVDDCVRKHNAGQLDANPFPASFEVRLKPDVPEAGHRPVTDWVPFEIVYST